MQYAANAHHSTTAQVVPLNCAVRWYVNVYRDCRCLLPVSPAAVCLGSGDAGSGNAANWSRDTTVASLWAAPMNTFLLRFCVPPVGGPKKKRSSSIVCVNSQRVHARSVQGAWVLPMWWDVAVAGILTMMLQPLVLFIFCQAPHVCCQCLVPCTRPCACVICPCHGAGSLGSGYLHYCWSGAGKEASECTQPVLNL